MFHSVFDPTYLLVSVVILAEGPRCARAVWAGWEWFDTLMQTRATITLEGSCIPFLSQGHAMI